MKKRLTDRGCAGILSHHMKTADKYNRLFICFICVAVLELADFTIPAGIVRHSLRGRGTRPAAFINFIVICAAVLELADRHV